MAGPLKAEAQKTAPESRSHQARQSVGATVRSSSTSSGAALVLAWPLVNAILSINCKCIVTDGRKGPRSNHNLARERMGVGARRGHRALEHRAVDSSQRFATAWRTPDLSDPAVLLTRHVP